MAQLPITQAPTTLPTPAPANIKQSIQEKWIDQWLNNNQATRSYKYKTVDVAGIKGIKLNILINMIWAASQAQGNNIPKNTITTYVELWLDAQDRKIIKQFSQLFTNTPRTSDATLRSWLKGLTGKVNELDLAVVKHFLWQVQRKLLELKVTYHMMPVIVGATGSGKSESVLYLLSYIEDLVNAPGSFKVAADERAATIFNENYVLFFDEMAYADKTDVDTLKNRITAPTVSYRIMTTNVVTSITNNTTFIGCANKTVKEMIYDTTGVRRFWEIQSLPKCDWSVVTKVNLAEVWHCVDPYADTPLLAYYDKIRAYQETELRNMDSVELFFNDNFVKSEVGESVRARELYREYTEWCDGGGEKSFTENRFGTYIKKYLKCHKDRFGTHYIIQRKSRGMIIDEDLENLPELTPEQKTVFGTKAAVLAFGKKGN